MSCQPSAMFVEVLLAGAMDFTIVHFKPLDSALISDTLLSYALVSETQWRLVWSSGWMSRWSALGQILALGSRSLIWTAKIKLMFQGFQSHRIHSLSPGNGWDMLGFFDFL